MRTFTRSAATGQSTFVLRPAAPFLRPLSIAPPLRLKEDKPQDPDEVEKAKHEQMKPGKGQSQERDKLSSSSESAIAAENEKVDDHGKHIEDLQQETAQQSEKDHPHGKDG